MTQQLACGILEAPTKLCLHCGAKVPERESSAYCCRGCATVHSFLNERKLNRFYALRDATQSARSSSQASAPGGLDAEGFDYLDDPEFCAEYALDDGREMRFYLEGVHCAACVWLTEKLPEFATGVESLKLDLSSGVARVRLAAGGSFARAAREIARLGYRPHPVKQGRSDELRQRENRQHLIQLGIAGMAAGNIMLLAVALYAGAAGSLGQVFRWTSLGLYLPVLFYSALPFYRSAWAALRKRQVSIDVPIVFGLLVGTGASVANLAIGSEHIYFDSLSALVFLLLATRYLLRRVNQHALNATEVAHFLAPTKAQRCDPRSGELESVPAESLGEGDLVRVFPGECFPVDGVVTDGQSAVDCALLSGESAPVGVAPGARVSAGTWNRQAPLTVRVTASGALTRLGRILSSMEREMSARAPIVAYLDRVGQAFVVAVLVLTGVGFLLGLSVSWHEAVNRALAVAIVVCPCTFALGTPLAISLAIGRLARAGTLVKGAEALERFSRVRKIFFDKTGTLTLGELQVRDWRELAPGAAAALLALETRSTHPIARAVQRYFAARADAPAELPAVTEFAERAGVGLTGVIQGSRYEIRGFSRESAHTTVGIYRDGMLAGALTLADQVRPDSAATLARLRAMGIGVAILSGDASEPARAIAAQLGVAPKDVFAAAGPERKAELVKLEPFTLMVGDGANDAVAFASAYASVAVQGGMEVSLRAAGAYGTQPGVMPVYTLLATARQTMRVIRRNLAFAVFYNLLGIAVALTGHLDPLVAAVLMPASALTVFLSTILGSREARA